MCICILYIYRRCANIEGACFYVDDLLLSCVFYTQGRLHRIQKRTTFRPYLSAWSHQTMVEELKFQLGAIVEFFCRKYRRTPASSTFLVNGL